MTELVVKYLSPLIAWYMDLFIKSHCRALEIPAVLDQAVSLHERWAAAKEEDPQLAFSRVRDPNSHASLNQAHFPDLYYAAISYAKANRLLGENFQMSSSHLTPHTVMIDKYIKRMAAAELGELSEESKNKLIKLGYPVKSQSRRRGRPEDSDEDTEDEPPTRRPRGRQ